MSEEVTAAIQAVVEDVANGVAPSETDVARLIGSPDLIALGMVQSSGIDTAEIAAAAAE